GNTATDASSTNVISPASCGQAASGREQMFLFYLCPVTGTFSAEITTCGSSFDTVAYLRFGTCTGGGVGCNDDSLNCGLFSLQSDMISQNISTGGGLYFVVVDGYSSSAQGAYTVTVNF